MPCPYHPTAPTTLKRVPIEVYPLGDGDPYRLADAQMERCGVCDARWYDEAAVALLPHSALPPQEAPKPQDTWDC